jgi:hypothetical protein
MKPYAERHAEAEAYYKESMERVRTTPPPAGQKFPPGAKVIVTHIPGVGDNVLATVHHTYAHAYGGDNVTSYCLDFEGRGLVAWFEENQMGLAP